MLVPIAWLKELVEIKVSDSQLVHALSLKTVAAVKEVTKDYIELDLKGYNRPDFLAMRGLAYEVAAILGTKVLFTDPHESDFIWETKKLPKGLVEIEDTTLAPLYCVAKIEGLKVEKSNSEWIKKLTDSGMRSINNVTDVTNLMMLEHGQPLHAFDASKVESEKIVVRAAKAGEKIVTLDGKERVLDKQDLLIADQTKALGIAGVMGGLMSEVTDKTSTILLEAAVFDSTNIRRTAQRHSLFSEASRRFQHGINIRRLFYAFNDALTKYQELGGKVTAITIVSNTRVKFCHACDHLITFFDFNKSFRMKKRYWSFTYLCRYTFNI
jgi:phenylalanyl-tRNA synthetase beta chain